MNTIIVHRSSKKAYSLQFYKDKDFINQIRVAQNTAKIYFQQKCH